MVLDECIEAPAEESRTREAAARTLDWARRSREYFAQHGDPARQMLFGIVQGGTHRRTAPRKRRRARGSGFPRLRDRRAGGGRAARRHLRDDRRSATSRLPADRPRYLMGVGKPEQILGLRRAGHRHDGLRAADAQRAARLPVHFAGARADPERAVRERPAPDR